MQKNNLHRKWRLKIVSETNQNQLDLFDFKNVFDGVALEKLQHTIFKKTFLYEINFNQNFL